MNFEYKKITELAEIVSGGTPKSNVPEYWDGDILWATPTDISKNKTKLISNTERQITKSGLQKSSARILPEKSVLLTSRAPIGLVAINDRPMATNQGFKSLMPNATTSPDYLYWWLKSNTEKLKQMGTGATFKEISKATVERLVLPIPPLEEQKRIAGILDQAEELRQKRRRTLALLDELKQSIFIEMFDDLVINTKQFEMAQLGEVCDVRDGTHDSPKYVESGHYLLTSKNFKDGAISYENAKMISEIDFININKRSGVNVGDIVMPMIGTIGGAVLIEDEPDYAIKNVALFKSTHLSPKMGFVRDILNSNLFAQKVLKSGRGGTQKFVSLGDLRSFEIPLPPDSLVDEYLERINKLVKYLTKLRASEGAMIELFTSLQHQAFSGELSGTA